MKKNFRLLIAACLALVMTLSVLTGCAPQQSSTKASAKDASSITLSTTTSTQDSGLLDYLVPEFKKDTGLDVKVVAVGTGQALQNGRDGNADVLLVHAKADEEKFVAEGHGLARFDVMYNDYILIGPEKDPLGIAKSSGSDIVKALKTISGKKASFISRGDDSGTHKKELALWALAGIETAGDWYVSAGQGMGATIQMASEKSSYTIADRATYLSMKDSVNLKIVCEKDKGLLNQYGVIAVNPAKNALINGEGAQKFVEWILSDKVQKMINEFGKEKYGQSLFIANGSRN